MLIKKHLCITNYNSLNRREKFVTLFISERLIAKVRYPFLDLLVHYKYSGNRDNKVNLKENMLLSLFPSTTFFFLFIHVYYWLGRLMVLQHFDYYSQLQITCLAVWSYARCWQCRFVSNVSLSTFLIGSFLEFSFCLFLCVG